MKIAAIVVTYKNPNNELSTLRRSLTENGIREKDMYFSDNAKENLGYGGGINRILKTQLKQYDAFFIVNPDVILHTNCLSQLVKDLENTMEIGIVGPKILDSKGRIWSLGGELDKKRYSGGLIEYGKVNKKVQNKNNFVDFISGTAMLIRKEVFEKVGLFAEDYFLYYEDVDFCLRARRAGFRLAVNPQAEITHVASTTVGKDSPIMQYYLARNHMWIVERYAPLSVKLHEFFRLPKTLFQTRKYEAQGILDYILRKKGKYENWG